MEKKKKKKKGTNIKIQPNLVNPLHPLLQPRDNNNNNNDKKSKEKDRDADNSFRNLEQPLRLASYILHTKNAEQWLANILAHDVFHPCYHGRLRIPQSNFSLQRNWRAPFAIVRYERAGWSEDRGFPPVLLGDDWVREGKIQGRNESRKMSWGEEEWRRVAARKLEQMKGWVELKSDGGIWESAGWAGYTCRVPREWMPELGEEVERLGRNRGRVSRGVEGLGWARGFERGDYHVELSIDGDEEAEGEEGAKRNCETVEMVKAWDRELWKKGEREHRHLQILVMKQYADRLGKLSKCEREGEDEWLATAFMATVTILHE